MNIYHYHPDTGELVGQGQADPDPMDDNNWLIPAYATDHPPPTADDRQVAVYREGVWALVPDYRGTVFWTADGERHEITELGVEPSADALDDPPPEPIETLAARKRREIDTARDQAFAEGLPYDIAGEPDVIQTRPEDKTNLLGIAIEARALAAEGVTDPVIEFRGLSNVNRTLTPQQVIDLTNAASAHIKGIYKRSWERKDAIDAALEAEDREGIEAVVW